MFYCYIGLQVRIFALFWSLFLPVLASVLSCCSAQAKIVPSFFGLFSPDLEASSASNLSDSGKWLFIESYKAGTALLRCSVLIASGSRSQTPFRGY